jgi:urease accessory protein
MATAIYAGERCESLLEPVREAIGDDGGASAWGGKLLMRIAATDGLELRSKLIPALSVLMDGRPLPKVWQI